MGKKKHNINFKVDDRELGIIESMAELYDNQSDALRDAIRVSRVLFHPRMTLDKFIKEDFTELVVENQKFREDVPLKDIIKTVPELEDEIKKEY